MKLPLSDSEGQRFVGYMRYLRVPTGENDPYCAGKKNEIRAYIAGKIGRSIDNIAGITETGWRNHFKSAGGKDHLWNEYYFIYQYRESYEICEQWEESWNERCHLQ
jgi:hypothetical protein